MKRIELRQIFYDETSLLQSQKPFIPLNNVDGDKTWFEFFAILNFIAKNELQDDVFYDFFLRDFPSRLALSLMR
ncbi:MAG: hypothetical protein ACI9SP_000769 [Arenicella sp.]|jgi:hypothetical protein